MLMLLQLTFKNHFIDVTLLHTEYLQVYIFKIDYAKVRLLKNKIPNLEGQKLWLYVKNYSKLLIKAICLVRPLDPKFAILTSFYRDCL